MTSPTERGKHPYGWVSMEDGPACWACGETMTEFAPGVTVDTWHCTDPDCDVTQRIEKRGMTGA